MPKAILELEMPVSCETCPIKRYFHYGWVEYICVITGEEIANKGRRSDCPLKLADEHCRNAEWVNGKCRGHRISPYTYEVLVQCKNCKDFEEYEEVEQE